jgi:hypothetical protein
VGFPDAAYDRSMTPDGPREIVIDHDDLDEVARQLPQQDELNRALRHVSLRRTAPGAARAGRPARHIANAGSCSEIPASRDR